MMPCSPVVKEEVAMFHKIVNLVHKYFLPNEKGNIPQNNNEKSFFTTALNVLGITTLAISIMLMSILIFGRMFH